MNVAKAGAIEVETLKIELTMFIWQDADLELYKAQTLLSGSHNCVQHGHPLDMVLNRLGCVGVNLRCNI